MISKFNELLGAVGEVLDASVLRDGDHILNAASVFALQINTGLDRDDVSALEDLLGSGRGGKTGILVNEHAHAVTERMPEASLISRAVDEVARCLVHRGAGNALGGKLESRLLCGENRVVDLFDFGVCLAEHDGTRHIRAVAADARTEVQREEAALKLLAAGNAVGKRRGTARDRDGVKGEAVRAVLAHKEFQLEGYVYLGHLGVKHREDVRERRVGHRLCVRDRGKLVGVLVQAHIGKDLGGTRLERDLGELFLEAGKDEAGERVVLDGDGLAVVLLEEGRHLRDVSVGGSQHLHLTGGLCLCRLDVTEVGQKVGRSLGDEDVAVVKIKAGEVELVELVGNDGGVKALADHCRTKIGKTRHNKKLLSGYARIGAGFFGFFYYIISYGKSVDFLKKIFQVVQIRRLF